MATPTISMELTGLGVSRRKVAEMIMTSPALAAQALFTSATKILVRDIRKALRTNKTIFEGGLHKRIGAKATVSSTGLAIVDVGTFGVPYGLAVEEGQPPGTTQDLNKLIRYARIKLGVDPDSATKVGLSLKRTIEARGSKPHPFLMPTFEADKLAVYSDFVIRLRLALAKRFP